MSNANKNVPTTVKELPWLKMSNKATKAVKLARSVQRMKHGLFANIPIVCHGMDCPYGETCIALGSDVAPVDEPCPVEISMILELYDKYTQELSIDITQMVNLSILKSLIDAEITISRCEAILAKDANIIQEFIVTVTQFGQQVKNPGPHIALAIKEKAIKQKNEALQLLNSTPKDKAKTEGAKIIDPSTYASRLLAEVRKIEAEKQEKVVIIDAEVEDVYRE
jgi:hypothetical protein